MLSIRTFYMDFDCQEIMKGISVIKNHADMVRIFAHSANFDILD